MSSSAPTEPKGPLMDAAADKREEAFLRRWSRRKHEARIREDEVSTAKNDVALPVPTPTPEKALTDADMPPVESLNADSDYSMFMSSGVSEGLRRQALRKLFTLPEFNQRCPLDSEWYDCRNLEPLGNIITHEVREELEREAQKLKERAVAALRDEPIAPSKTVAAESSVIQSADLVESPPAQDEGNSDNESSV